MGPSRWTACVGFFLSLVACGTETASPEHAGFGPSGSGGLGRGGQGGEAGATVGSGGATDAASDAGDRDTSSSSDGTIDRTVLDATGTPDAAIVSDASREAAGDVASRPARVLLYHFSTLDIPSVPAQLAFYKNKLGEWGFQADDSITAPSPTPAEPS